MKPTIHTLVTTLVMASALSSCNHSSSGGSSNVTTNFALTGSGQNAVARSPLQKGLSLLLPSAVALTPPPLEDANQASVQLEKAWIVLKKIQFKSKETAEASESSETDAHYKGPFFIDLLSDTPLSFGKISVPAEGLRRVKMLLHKDNHVPSSASSELDGKSIFLKGSVNSSSFTYLADDTTDFEISGPNAIVPEEGKDLLATIRLADLFKKIDLSGITSDTVITSSSRFPATNPCPTIHATASDLYTCFRKGLAQEAKFGKDNGDHDLDSHDDVVND